MPQFFGDFIQEFPLEHDSLEITFTPSTRPIKQRWKNNRLSAHFVADYFSNFLPVDEDNPHSKNRIKESKASVSYIANELLENAIKFNDEELQQKVRFGIHFLENTDTIKAVISTTNTIKTTTVDKLAAFIEELLSADPNDLYIRQVEKSIEEDTKASGLGLLTMINDYSAKLGWKLEENIVQNSPIIMVTTMAQIEI